MELIPHKWQAIILANMKGGHSIHLDVIGNSLLLAKHVVAFGVGEGEKAHGFTIICGDATKLLEVKTKRTISDNVIEYGVVGHSLLGEKQYFHAYHPNICDKNVCCDRQVLAAFKEDGAIIVDIFTGELRCMNYIVGDIRMGHDGGGARHMSASAVAINEDAGGCVVLKASEEVCKKGTGMIDVFLAERLPTPFYLKDDMRSLLQKKEMAGTLLADVGEWDVAIYVFQRMIASVEGLPEEKASLMSKLADVHNERLKVQGDLNSDISNRVSCILAHQSAVEEWECVDPSRRDNSRYATLLSTTAMHKGELHFCPDFRGKLEDFDILLAQVKRGVDLLRSLDDENLIVSLHCLGRVKWSILRRMHEDVRKVSIEDAHEATSTLKEALALPQSQHDSNAGTRVDILWDLAFWHGVFGDEATCREFLKQGLAEADARLGPDSDRSMKIRRRQAQHDRLVALLRQAQHEDTSWTTWVGLGAAVGLSWIDP